MIRKEKIGILSNPFCELIFKKKSEKKLGKIKAETII
jgi:hypothetical protein